jgi:hypothetical protein
MTTINFKVTLAPVVLKVDPESYRDVWIDACDNDGDLSEGEAKAKGSGDIPLDFLLEKVRQDIEENDGFADELAAGTIDDVTIVT